MKTWCSIDGELEPIDFPGSTHFRFPLQLPLLVLEEFSEPGDVVLDPFCGFGTTIVAGQRLGRTVIGFEKDRDRGEFARARAVSPCQVIVDDIRNIRSHDLPMFDLLFTSPPFSSLGDWVQADFESYFGDFRQAFLGIAPYMRDTSRIIVELSNVREPTGVRPVLWSAGAILSSIFHLESELVRCNTGDTPAAPGYDHSTLLIFRATPPS